MNAVATYFIDVIDGKYDNDGLSEDAAISSYEALDVKPGDTVLFKCGTFIRNRLNNRSGEPGKPITYGAYGRGEKPTFCASVNLTVEALWVEEKENIWRCVSLEVNEAANFIFNKSHLCGTLKWRKEDLEEQGDFFDNCFGFAQNGIEQLSEHQLYLFSKTNPAKYYSDIECAHCKVRSLADGGHDIIFKDLRFVNNGIHGIAGLAGARNIKLLNCDFELIGGAVFSIKDKIRFGNAVEFWNVAENVEVKGCYFNDIYDSATTHQGDEVKCKPANKYIITDNVFIKCGMAAYEQRDRMSINSVFNNNICINAGEGFSKNGEIMPRFSEIWPQPMGHHIFLWRINEPSNGGALEIRNNVFYNAPYGACIYSIISKEAEEQVAIESNVYYTENEKLLNRWNKVEFLNFEEYSPFEKDCKYEKINIEDIKKANIERVNKVGK